jgi:hypothetical protein
MTLRDALRTWPVHLLREEAIDMIEIMGKNDLTMFLTEYQDVDYPLDEELIIECAEEYLRTKPKKANTVEKFNSEKT